MDDGKMAMATIQHCAIPSSDVFQRSSLPIPRSSYTALRRIDLQNRRCHRMVAMKAEPLRVMISGAPASGKGTQCELIVDKYGLVHIAAGDLLRVEVASGSENGRLAKQYMDQGKLVPNDIVVTMVKHRLDEEDAQQHGWLLDGYPRSLSQAEALEAVNISPQIFILLEVPEEILVDRVVGRRMDPVTGKIYHLTYAPPPTEIFSRLTQRSDDTEERVKLRLKTHHQNVQDVLSTYQDVIKRVDGNRRKEQVFQSIENILQELHNTNNSKKNIPFP